MNPPYDAPDPRGELLRLLEQTGIPFLEEGEEIRFVLCEGGCQWETVCRFSSQTVLIYGVYPFPVNNRARALELASEVNAQLQQGGLFLSDHRLALRVSAVLSDIYIARESLISALEYSASAIRYFWEELRAGAG